MLTTRSWLGRALRSAAGILLLLTLVLQSRAGSATATDLRSRTTAAFSASGSNQAASGCRLSSAGGAIQHAIYIQFDNTHFLRDDPNVPSDLEQMPSLLNFIESNGTLLTSEHTPLIAHTADDVVTSLTGLYGDRTGVPVANSYGYFKPDGTTGSTPAFTYWSDTTPDGTYNMLSAPDTNTPAPWAPFTRAGCNVGGFAIANMVPEANDLHQGVAIHCAQGAALCSAANNGQPDLLPSEPGGYDGFQALFGHQDVAAQISPGTSLLDLDGNPIDKFPGFDPSAAQTLAYVLAMQTHGVPVTYAYIADAHDDHSPAGGTYGPGEAGYEAQLQDSDAAFASFFQQLAVNGIGPNNTLFVITADEGDRFVGGSGAPDGCTGAGTLCSYSHTTCDGSAGSPCPANNVGQIGVNVQTLLSSQAGITTPFSIHADSAPTFYIAGNPAPDDAVARTFERAVARLTVTNPLTGASDTLTNELADPVEERLLHMVTADPNRTPTFTMFADPDYNIQTSNVSQCDGAVCQNGSDDWDHGGIAPEINTTWLGLVGPGVRNAGIDAATWSDHTDIRPTMLLLLGLQDDYAHEGRALLEEIDDSALPPSVAARRDELTRLGELLSQINAPVGDLALASLRASTAALTSNDPGDQGYAAMEASLASLTQQRDQVAADMIAYLEQAEFGASAAPGSTASAAGLIDQANALLAQAQSLAGGAK